MRVSFLLLIAMSFALFACNARKSTIEETHEPPADAQFVCVDTISYSSSIKQIFEARCIKCHSGPRAAGGIDLTTYENASKVVDFRLLCVINWEDNCNRMPPLGGQLTELQRNLIECWLENGKKN